MATKKDIKENKGRTTNFIPYDPNTDEERSPASAYLPPVVKPAPTPTPKPEEASYEAEREVEAQQPKWDAPAPPLDQPPTLSPTEPLNEPVDTYSPETIDQPPSLNIRQFEYAQEARGDQPPSFSIPTPPPLPTFDRSDEPSVESLDELNSAKSQYNQQAEALEKETQKFNRLVEEQNFRVEGLNEIAKEIEAEVGESPVNIEETQRREAQLIALQNDLDDRYNKFVLNPYGETNQEGYFVEVENIIEEQNKINEEIDFIASQYDDYNNWVNISNQPDIKALRNQYELKSAELSELDNKIAQEAYKLNVDIENTNRLYNVLEARENELSAFTRDLASQYDPVRRNLLYSGQVDPYNELGGASGYVELSKPVEVDKLALSEKAVEALNVSPRMSTFYYDPDPKKEGVEIWTIDPETDRYKKSIIPSVTEAEERAIEAGAQARPLTGLPVQDVDQSLETFSTDYEPRSRLEKYLQENPIEITTGDVAKSIPIIGMGVTNPYSKKLIQQAETGALNWLDENIGKYEVGGIIQDSIYATTKYGNNALYSIRRVIKNENDVDILIRDLKRAQDQADAVKSLGDWEKSQVSPQVGTVVEFLDIPYYYNQIKKLDDIRLIKLDGDKRTDITDLDDYALAVTTLGGLTLKDRGIRIPDIGYIDDTLELTGRVALKYIGQTPDEYKKMSFWLSSPLAELPKYDRLEALRREDDFIDRAFLGDVFFPRAETGRVLRRYEDEEGNAPEGFTWGLKKADNILGYEVDEEAIKSERYKELLPYLQARAEDDYIRPLDLGFTLAEIATFYPSALFAGKVGLGAVRKSAKGGLAILGLPANLKQRATDFYDSNFDPNNEFYRFLKNNPKSNLTPFEQILKTQVNINEANINLQKAFDGLHTEKTKDLIKQLSNIKDKELRKYNLLEILPTSLVAPKLIKLQKALENQQSIIAENNITKQIADYNKMKSLTPDEIEARDYLLYLRDEDYSDFQKQVQNQTFQQALFKDFKKLSRDTANKKIREDLALSLYSGVPVKASQLNTLSEHISTPIHFFRNPSEYSLKNSDFQNQQIADQKIYSILNEKDIDPIETSELINNEYEMFAGEKWAENSPILEDINNFFRTFNTNKKSDFDGATFEDLKIGLLTKIKKRQEPFKKNVEILASSESKLSPNLRTAIRSVNNFLNKMPTTKIKSKKTNAQKNEEALIGRKIVLPKSFTEAEKLKPVSDGKYFEDLVLSSQKKEPDTNKKGGSKPPPTDAPDGSLLGKIPPTELPPKTQEPDATRLREPDGKKVKRLREPDATRLREPDAQGKKIKEPDTTKKREPDTTKKREPDTTKRKKTKDPKRLREPEKIKEPDVKKKKKKRLKDKDLPTATAGEGDQDVKKPLSKKSFPAVIQWKDGDKYFTYDLNTNETKERDYPISGGVKAGNTPEKSVKIIRRSSTRPKFFKKKIGNLTLQIKSPQVVTVKKLEKNLYNKTKAINFKS